MKKFNLTLLVLLIFTIAGYTQIRDTSSHVKINFYKKQLKTDETTATSISNIIDNYKMQVKAVVNDKSLNDIQKRNKIDKLIGEKNAALHKIISAQQIKLIIPTSEQSPVM